MDSLKISKETQKEMVKFFMKTSVPRLLAKKREEERRAIADKSCND